MKTIAKIFFVILWALLILAGYYYFHKPFTPEQFLQILAAATDMIGSFLILAICGGLGYKIIPSPGTHKLAAFSFQAALGCGLVSLVWLGLGLAGLVRWWVAALLLLAALVILRTEILAWIRSLSGWAPIWQNAGNLGRLFLLVSVVLVLNQVWIALAPPVKYDALSYHLALPNVYIAQGRLVLLADNPYWGHPQLVEMLFTWANVLGRPSTAAVLSWFCGVVFLTGLAGFTNEHLPAAAATDKTRAGAAAAALVFVLAGATARWMLAWAYTDLFSAWMGLGVLIALFRWHESGQKGWMCLSAVFTGLAVSTKYTAGIIAVALFLGIWLVRTLRKPPLKLWLASGLIAVLVFLPWALKNIAYTGNPLFPYLFPTQTYNAQRLAAANLPSADYSLPAQFYLPVYLTWAGVDSAPGPSTDLGPLLVLFALPALWIGRKNPQTQILGFSLLFAWLAISIAGARFGHLNQPRLFYVLLPALAVLAGWGWVQLQTITAAGIRLSRILAVIVGLVLSLTLLQDSNHLLASGALQTVTGLQTRQSYLENNTGVYITAMDALSSLPQDSRVLMLWEARGLYAPGNTTPDSWIDRWRSSLRQLGSPQAVLADWRAQGFSHVLLHKTGMDFMRSDETGMPPAEWEKLDEFLDMLPPPQPIAGPYYLLYELKDR